MARRRYQAKNKAYTLKRMGLLALAVLLVAGAVFGVRAILKEKDSYGSVAELPFYSEAVYGYGGGVFYYVADGKLNRYDPADPENISSTQLAVEDVTIVSSASLTALYTGASAQILGAAEVVDAGGQILGLRCGKSHVAIMRQDANGDVAVLVYDKNAQLVDAVEQGSMLLLDCGFSSAGGSDLMWTLMLDSSGSVPVNALTTYTYAADDSGTVKASMSGVTSVQSQLVEDVLFTDKSIYLSGTEQLIRCDSGVSGESWRLLTYGYRLADASTTGARPLFVFVSRDAQPGQWNSVKLYSADEAAQANATARTVQLPQGALAAMATGGRLAVFTQNKLYLYSSAGTLTKEYELGFGLESAVKLSDNAVLAQTTEGALRLITLK